MKVFIADDSNSVIERLTDLLEEIPGTQLVGCAGNVSEAVRGLQERTRTRSFLTCKCQVAVALMYFVQSAQSIPIFKL